MTTEEQYRSSEIYQTNGTEDIHGDDNDSETTLSSSGPAVRRSRFFRSKRKQRLHEDQVNSNGDESNEAVSPESAVEEPSTSDTSNPVQENVNRCASPPPPAASSSALTDDANEPSTSEESSKASTSTEDLADEHRSVPTSQKSSIPPTPPVSSIYSGYQRKKSQSVKLTRIGAIDACPKKAVRFADDFGLDLSQIKMIKTDELPHVPSAAFKDLHITSDENTFSCDQERMRTITYLEQAFENPIHAHGFDDRVARHKIVLEQANAIDNRIYGTIKLVSFGMNKRVQVRLSTDNWLTSDDYDATYISNSFDGTHDRFTFMLEINRDRIKVGSDVQFCLHYESHPGSDYWDSHYQANYRFNCVSRTIPDYSS